MDMIWRLLLVLLILPAIFSPGLGYLSLRNFLWSFITLQWKCHHLFCPWSQLDNRQGLDDMLPQSRIWWFLLDRQPARQPTLWAQFTCTALVLSKNNNFPLLYRWAWFAVGIVFLQIHETALHKSGDGSTCICVFITVRWSIPPTQYIVTTPA